MSNTFRVPKRVEEDLIFDNKYADNAIRRAHKMHIHIFGDICRVLVIEYILINSSVVEKANPIPLGTYPLNMCGFATHLLL